MEGLHRRETGLGNRLLQGDRIRYETIQFLTDRLQASISRRRYDPTDQLVNFHGYSPAGSVGGRW